MIRSGTLSGLHRRDVHARKAKQDRQQLPTTENAIRGSREDSRRWPAGKRPLKYIKSRNAWDGERGFGLSRGEEVSWHEEDIRDKVIGENWKSEKKDRSYFRRKMVRERNSRRSGKMTAVSPTQCHKRCRAGIENAEHRNKAS